MSTTPVPATAESPNSEPRHRFVPEHQRPDDNPAATAAGAREGTRTEAPAPVLTDRTVEAGLLIDIPQLVVDELSLELEAAHLVNRVKLEAKGLEAGLYLKANPDQLQGLRPDTGGSHPSRLRSGLRDLLGTAREPDRDGGEDEEPRALEAGGDEPDAAQDAGGGAERPAGRARHAAAEGMKAAALTAAGLAGGALLDARANPAHKLPFSLPHRRGRVEKLRDEVRKRLP